MRASIALPLLLGVLTVGCGDDDSSSAPDSSAADASNLPDARTPDAGAADAAMDSGPRDSGPRDSGPRDTGPHDSAALDSTVGDSGPELDAAADSGPTDDAALATDAGGGTPTERGESSYARYCALCHGESAEGYAADNAPAIGNPDFLRIATDLFIERAIADGRPGTPMSAWAVEHGGPLSPTDVTDIVAFLRSLATEPPLDVSTLVVTGDATRGAPIYASQCATCHGADGRGASALSLNHPNFQATASDGFLRFTVEHGRRDTAMPAFVAMLGETEIDDVVAHVRTLRRSDMPPDWPVESVPTVDSLVINPDGEPPTFELRDGRYVPAIVVKAALDAGRRIILLDARTTSDWMLGHIPGAAPFPFYDVDALAAGLPDDGTWIVAYCACPHAASGRVVDMLRKRGFANTAVLDEGIFFWRDQGYPMATGTL
ncbi:MAG: c-type cytochrome [Deltaproteobacteria bacterium]|nr:c-type cytochrome [Deltaproteobacteria bacterium]